MNNSTNGGTIVHPKEADCGGLCDIIADSDNVTNAEPKKLTSAGKILLGISGALFVGFNVVAVPFVAPGLRKICLPFLPANPAQVQNVLKALSGRRGTLLDIGSGDGRIVSVSILYSLVSNDLKEYVWSTC